MENIVEEEYQEFLKDMSSQETLFGKYLETNWYRKEIHNAQELLKKKIQNYIDTNYPNKFVVYYGNNGICVRATEEEARKRIEYRKGVKA